ncbi:unnamed protein product [Rotaria sp. Silwood1]|nr:unnamed protein product [Rotaria sp. Silwood1]CAF1610743.1 unnamed protein product [Rotaria sp. Silwood1]CAF3719241.1 unnamed protein product [Rotaria sp. Silwood1]CAF3763790.1 unnamed protein product [Rotaria sp. Silwood1]CAF4823673.1 unnamed protein product [Rotaria sp. Silwood1]
MESNSDDLNTIVRDIFTEYLSSDDNSSNIKTVHKTEPLESANFSEPELCNTKNTNRRPFLFIIHNNARWSQLSKERPAKRSEENEQKQQQKLRSVTEDRHVSSPIQREKQETSLDDQFIVQLRQLIYEYVEHTTRPMPVKYFIDLSDP